MTPLRVDVGWATARPPSVAFLNIAMDGAGLAKKHGLRVIKLVTSRTPGSVSRYIELCDRLGREWLLRVSDHPHGGPIVHVPPHVDIVSRDGVAGGEALAAAIHAIAAGLLQWTDREPLIAALERRR